MYVTPINPRYIHQNTNQRTTPVTHQDFPVIHQHNTQTSTAVTWPKKLRVIEIQNLRYQKEKKQTNAKKKIQILEIRQSQTRILRVIEIQNLPISSLLIINKSFVARNLDYVNII